MTLKYNSLHTHLWVWSSNECSSNGLSFISSFLAKSLLYAYDDVWLVTAGLLVNLSDLLSLEELSLDCAPPSAEGRTRSTQDSSKNVITECFTGHLH